MYANNLARKLTEWARSQPHPKNTLKRKFEENNKTSKFGIDDLESEVEIKDENPNVDNPMSKGDVYNQNNEFFTLPNGSQIVLQQFEAPIIFQEVSDDEFAGFEDETSGTEEKDSEYSDIEIKESAAIEANRAKEQNEPSVTMKLSEFQQILQKLDENNKLIKELKQDLQGSIRSIRKDVNKLTKKVFKRIPVPDTSDPLTFEVSKEYFPIRSDDDLEKVEAVVTGIDENEKLKILHSVIACPPNGRVGLRSWQSLFIDKFTFDYTLKGFLPLSKKSLEDNAPEFVKMIRAEWAKEIDGVFKIMQKTGKKVFISPEKRALLLIIEAIEKAKKRFRKKSPSSVEATSEAKVENLEK